MLKDTSMNSSSDGTSSSLKRRCLVSSAELVAEIRSNTDLVCVGDEQVQSEHRRDDPLASTVGSVGHRFSFSRFVRVWNLKRGTTGNGETITFILSLIKITTLPHNS